MKRRTRSTLLVLVGVALVLPASVSFAGSREFNASKLVFSDKELDLVRPVHEPKGFGALSSKEKNFKRIDLLRYERQLEFGGLDFKLKVKAPHKKRSLLYLQVKF